LRIIQANATVCGEEDPAKFEVGARLIFVAYNPEELEHSTPSVWFQSGDILIVEPRNKCGIGIDVRREFDGAADMIFSEEVELET